MDEERRKAKRLAAGLFALCLFIALICFGIFVYLLFKYRLEGSAGKRTPAVCKILVMTGIFFLVIALGYLLPVLLSHKKRERE